MSRTSPPRRHVVCARGRCTDAGNLAGIDLGCALEISRARRTICVDKPRWTGLTGDRCVWGVRGGAAVLRQFIWPQPRLGRNNDAHAHKYSSISFESWTAYRPKHLLIISLLAVHSEGAQITHSSLMLSLPELHEGPRVRGCRRHALQSTTTTRTTESICIDRAA